jgi:hypothetical protein
LKTLYIVSFGKDVVHWGKNLICIILNFIHNIN